MATKNNSKSKKNMKIEESQPILFNGDMRKVFVEGVLQDIKGYFEHKTNGKVVVKYDDFTLKDHEFGFKLYVEKTSSCKKQMWSEVSSAVVNVVNFMFSMDNSTIDVSICAENGKLEVEVVSKW